MRIGITGSLGLIGTALGRALTHADRDWRGLDLQAPEKSADHGDVRDPRAVEHLVTECDLIVHLAAVSRVVFGERDPALCWSTNVDGTRNLLEAALRRPSPPVVIVASSREVYGEPRVLPVPETAPLHPINVYGRSKRAAELTTQHARARGLRAVVLRFSNVCGSVHDHPDRVVPAFARAAAHGGTLRVDGEQHTFDFCHIDDCVDGILRAIGHLEAGRPPFDPIHLVTGRPTTLGQLAQMALAAGRGRATIRRGPVRAYDVARFVGCTDRAKRVLGWRAQRSIEWGVARLVREFCQLEARSRA